MAKTSFENVSHETVKQNPKAIEYLLSASGLFGGLQSAFEGSAKGYGHFFLVHRGIDLIGAIYQTITTQDTGKVMTSVLLGGDDFASWAADLSEFYYRFAKENNCDEFMLMGRRGFKRYFPELEEVATVFRVKLSQI